jgi:hypothetical protein
MIRVEISRSVTVGYLQKSADPGGRDLLWSILLDIAPLQFRGFDDVAIGQFARLVIQRLANLGKMAGEEVAIPFIMTWLTNRLPR